MGQPCHGKSLNPILWTSRLERAERSDGLFAVVNRNDFDVTTFVAVEEPVIPDGDVANDGVLVAD